MRTLGILLAFILGPFSGAATAAQLSVSRQIHIRGTVPITQTVILNSNNQVAEIISNSQSAGELRIFKGQVNSQNQLPPTPQIIEAYHSIINNHPLRIGTVYELDTDVSSDFTVSELAI